MTPQVLADYDEKLAKLNQLAGTRGRLLDVGCGAAYLVERAAINGWDAYGVEIGEWAREAASVRGVKNVYHWGTARPGISGRSL
jgi:2-polyprenyl-3-methyl-5-hydroxy-6-metoxy-1,4-benzoquinol methylase